MYIPRRIGEHDGIGITYESMCSSQSESSSEDQELNENGLDSSITERERKIDANANISESNTKSYDYETNQKPKNSHESITKVRNLIKTQMTRSGF